MENDKQFYLDLAKIQNQYNYASRDHGSISIYDIAEDGKIAAGVNWSALGSAKMYRAFTVNTKTARAFAETLLAAIEACEQFNRTHEKMNTMPKTLTVDDIIELKDKAISKLNLLAEDMPVAAIPSQIVKVFDGARVDRIKQFGDTLRCDISTDWYGYKDINIEIKVDGDKPDLKDITTLIETLLTGYAKHYEYDDEDLKALGISPRHLD